MNHTHTVRCCFVGYIVQAIVNNFVPLLFLTLQAELGLSLPQITSLITVNFAVQFTVDLISASYVEKIGYRRGIVAAHFTAAAGLAGLTFLPQLLPDAYIGLLLSVIIYAVGGGLLEVLVSPIVEACPTEHKEKTMSMLHSFYCWGQAGVVLLSTLFFLLFGIENWRIPALVWACIPAVNGILFLKVPITSLLDENESAMTMRELFQNRLFWIFLLLMGCAGACELSVSQWASAFVEKAFGISKAMGDLAGPMMFALLMGTARLLYGKFGERIDLLKFILASGILCVFAYLLTGLSEIPLLGLVGCGICGFSVGILWPGVFSLAAASLRRGGAGMFALLALAGDVGCAGGPTLVGFVTDAAGENLHSGILAGTVFPVILLAGIALYRKERKSAQGSV
ncbi:MAG: MFS transporter [Oscillospiraceae bacterium]|nr:MFS transporter [Oscillospiraceae bacterium]MBQ9110607.1 MFS transporter [Oscillospiraceae bacterium]